MSDPLSPAEELVALRAGAVTAATDLTAANGLLTEAQGQITALIGERNLAQAEVTRLTGELGTATANLGVVTGERDTALGEASALKGAITTGGFFALAEDGKSIALTDTGKVQFVNDEATRITASTGHRQMPLAVDKNALGNGGATAGNSGVGRTKTTWNK